MAIIIPGTGTTGPIQTLTETVKNTSGATLLKGTPVRITGATGQEADVGPADASTAFPANFILAETLAPGESGQAVALGFINNVSVPNASLFTAGQEVYLGVGGGWTTTRPTGAANIQLLGNIVKVNTGANTVSGIFAPQNIEYLPNLTQGRTWIGNSSGLAEEFNLTSELSSRDTANRNRANHTGTQPWDSITETPTTLAGYGISISSPEIITTPTGIVYRFTQPTKPVERSPGVPLGIGDRWYNTTHGVDTVWNGTYWVGRVRDLGHLGANSIFSSINANYLFNLPTVMGEPTSGKYLISFLFRSVSTSTGDASNHFRFTQSINDVGGIWGGEFYSYDPYVNGYIGIRDVYYDFFARPCWFILQHITKVGNPSTLSYNYNGIIIKEVY